MATLKDIAPEAGVSKTLVPCYLSGSKAGCMSFRSPYVDNLNFYDVDAYHNW